MFPLWLLPFAGAGIGALTNLNNPEQTMKNMSTGLGLGTLGAGIGALGPSLMGMGPEAIELGASNIPQYSLTGAAEMGTSPALQGLPQLAGNPELMGVNPALASASGGTVANSDMPIQTIMALLKFASKPGQTPKAPTAPAAPGQPNQNSLKYNSTRRTMSDDEALLEALYRTKGLSEALLKGG